MIIAVAFIFAVGYVAGYALADIRNKEKTKQLLEQKDRVWKAHFGAVNARWRDAYEKAKSNEEIDMEKIIVNERKYYVEIDRIRLIYEDGELVGWYNPNGNEVEAK